MVNKYTDGEVLEGLQWLSATLNAFEPMEKMAEVGADYCTFAFELHFRQQLGENRIIGLQPYVPRPGEARHPQKVEISNLYQKVVSRVEHLRKLGEESRRREETPENQDYWKHVREQEQGMPQEPKVKKPYWDLGIAAYELMRHVADSNLKLDISTPIRSILTNIDSMLLNIPLAHLVYAQCMEQPLPYGLTDNTVSDLGAEERQMECITSMAMYLKRCEAADREIKNALRLFAHIPTRAHLQQEEDQQQLGPKEKFMARFDEMYVVVTEKLREVELMMQILGDRMEGRTAQTVERTDADTMEE